MTPFLSGSQRMAYAMSTHNKYGNQHWEDWVYLSVYDILMF